MKFDSGPTPEEYAADKMKWRPWFAWFPVQVGPHDSRWLEMVERRQEYDCRGYGISCWSWHYRALQR